MRNSKTVSRVSKSATRVSWISLVFAGACGLPLLASAQEVPEVSEAQAAPEVDDTNKELRRETIYVTATRRAESAQDIPLSISALSEEQLKESGALQASDVARLVPGFAYTEVNPGQAVLAVRGVQTSAVFGNLQQPVALYYDDVPVLDLTIPWTVPRLQLFDVERVEVLRGPQGTLFGAGALSGAVRVINEKPNLTEYEGAVDATVTSTKGGGIGSSLNLMLNAPLVNDELAIRAVGYYDKSAGWVDNSVFPDENTNRGESYGGRVAVKWAPTDSFTLVGTAAVSVNEPNDSAYVVYDSGSDTNDFRIRTFNTDDTKIFNLNADYSMSWADLTSSTSYMTRDASSSMDFSGFANLITGLTTVSPLNDEFDTNNFIQEVRLASNGDGRFEWIVGAYYENYDFGLREIIVQEGVSGIPLDFVSGPTYPTDNLEDVGITTSIEDYAVFGEVSYELVPGLKLTAGARYSDYSIDTTTRGAISGTTIFDGPPGSTSRSSKNSAFTPKVSLSYKPNSDVMIYALASKGFRTANANLTSGVDIFTGLPIPTSYDPDSLWNYEAGMKVALFDRRLTIDAAAFHIDWEDIQLQVRTASGLPYTDNAGTATSKGVEVSAVARMTEQLELGTSLAYTDATLDSVAPDVPDAIAGDQLPGSAPFTSYVYGQYEFPVTETINASLRLDHSYSGLAYAGLGNNGNPSALSYGENSEFGARATFDTGSYKVALFVQNLTNNRDRVAARDYFFTPVEIRQRPRTVGVNVSTSW